ncbi:MAG: rhodanese-like domain-containing protein [Proteobacteria bacterium]|nr:rhodanese-like domain-containing protein [Pseudomonadota bacterium]
MLKTVEELVGKAMESVKTLSAEDGAKFATGQKDVLFIDVREPSEHIEKSIPGVINIPRGLLEMKISSHTQDENRSILIHCAKGGRAILAAKALVDMGFRDVTAITAGCEDIAAAMTCSI